MRTRIKICCISSVNEAKLAIDHGADALGLVGKMPSGPGPVPDWLIAEIVKTISSADRIIFINKRTILGGNNLPYKKSGYEHCPDS
jgi:phosphoribosylanthranilate isomerase